jgi:hypothetical protein
METQADLNYHRIAEAIDYIKGNFKIQPNLDEGSSQSFPFSAAIYRLGRNQPQEVFTVHQRGARQETPH